MIGLVVSHRVVFLVVESDSCGVFGSTLVGQRLEQDLSLINDYWLLDVGIFFILNFEIVDGEGLDGEVSSANCSVLGYDVGGLSHSSCCDVVDVLFVDFSHRYVKLQRSQKSLHHQNTIRTKQYTFFSIASQRKATDRDHSVQSKGNISIREQILLEMEFNIIIQYNFTPHMKYLAAYALLTLAGKKNINANDLKAVLSSVQSTASDEELSRVVEALKGKQLHQLIAEGSKRVGASGPAAPAAGKGKQEKKEAPKKQQPKKKQEPKKKEEPKVEEADEDLGDLFG